MATRWGAFRHRNYRLYFAGQLTSLIGTWMQQAAQLWLVYQLTGSSLLLGLLGFASQVPIFLLGPLGGVVADVCDRRRVVLATQAISMLLAFLLAALTFTGVVHVWHVIGIACLLGLVNAVDIPARQAMVADLVPQEDLLNAIALNSTSFHSARIIGPAVGGALIVAVGEGWCFLLNGASFFAVLIALFAMRLPEQVKASRARSPLHHLLEGFRFVWEARPIRTLLVLLGLVSLVGTPYAVLLPVFATRYLHVGARELGLLMGAAGAGALIGAVQLAARKVRPGLTKWVVACAILCGLSLVGFSQSRSFWLSAALLLPVGFAITVQMAASNTRIQSSVTPGLRGRVMAVYAMMFMGVQPLGALLAGAAAQHIGAPLTVALGGAACVLGAIILGPRLLQKESREAVPQATAP